MFDYRHIRDNVIGDSVDSNERVMCDKCNKNFTPLIEVEGIPDAINCWSNVPFNEILTHSEHVVFEVRNDKGYIRFVDLDDCNCLDHGVYIEIQFCPFCGRKFKQNDSCN